ncbi:uncharacterized protein LOC135499006 [Lineus longissimus]|uniref:uncharacterized protein LOC135499006 n=1 Tax=Lineus longissimus TaxID=88925 RepID=UPI002B4F98D9
MTSLVLVKLLLLVIAFLCAEGLRRNERGDNDDRRELDEFSGKIPEIPLIPTDDAGERPLSKRSVTIFDRPGHASETHACTTVTAVPEDLRNPEIMFPNGLDVFYQKYTHAYGIPIIGSENVTDSALRRACYLVRFLFADRPDVREMFYKKYGRFGLMAHNEMTSDIPEHKHLTPHSLWDWRARGLGPTLAWPIVTGGEENTVCLKADRYPTQDIPLHELAHGVAKLGARYVIPDFDERLDALYAAAKASGEWGPTYMYAMKNSAEYWAEAAQSFFDDNSDSKLSNRAELEEKDIGIFKLLKEIWPCNNKYLKRCYSSRELEDAQELKMNCKGMKSVAFTVSEDCFDKKPHCENWAKYGECTRIQVYMKRNCKKACGLCTLPATKYSGEANKGERVVGKPILTCGDVAADCKKSNCTANITYAIQQCRKTCTNCEDYLENDYGTFKASQAEDETQCKLGDGRRRCWWGEEFKASSRCTEDGGRVLFDDGKFNCACLSKSQHMYTDCKTLKA